MAMKQQCALGGGGGSGDSPIRTCRIKSVDRMVVTMVRGDDFNRELYRGIDGKVSP
jgi:hypothetical protein